MASDRERELVVDVLRDASNRGQLSVTEFDQRWDYLRAARTVGDLVPLVSDLPNVPPPAERPVGRRRRTIEPPPDGVMFYTPGGSDAAPDHSDLPDTPGAAMLPFEDHAWAESGPSAARAYDDNDGRRAVFGSPGDFVQRPDQIGADGPANSASRPAVDGEQHPHTPAAQATASKASAAEEWNTALQACIGSFALLIVSLLLAAVFS